MGINDALRDGKSEPETSVLGAEEWFVDAIAIIRGKSASVIGHSQANVRLTPFVGLHVL